MLLLSVRLFTVPVCAGGEGKRVGWLGATTDLRAEYERQHEHHAHPCHPQPPPQLLPPPQSQQQQQYSQLANMIWGLGQNITNGAINVGSGTQTASPTNTNTSIR